MESSPRPDEIFFMIHRDLPREGPGLDTCTVRALAAMTPRPMAAQVLDVGCGPGMQTLAVARTWPDATIDAVDMHPRFVDRLRISAEQAGMADRVHAQVADMRELPFPDATFDVVLCEGAAYFMGIQASLNAWRRVLKPGGWAAFTDAVWLGDSTPELEAFWAEYPQMTDVNGVLQHIRSVGWEAKAHFTLPEEAWWKYYYTPLEQRLDRLEREHGTDPAWIEAIRSERIEIDFYRRYPDRYGYVFFVVRAPAG